MEIRRKPKISPEEITLLPWDPKSPAHVKRLFEQRVACGWKSHMIEPWRQWQREGKMALQWITFASSSTTKDIQLSSHLKAFPSESEPLSDTAISLGNKPRSPTNEQFIPIGHISLDSWNEDPERADGERGIYRIMNFYVSDALRGSGLGGAAMDKVESIAIGEPLYARRLTLGTVATEYEELREERLLATGKEKLAFSVSQWYARRGYVAYKIVPGAYADVDSTGKTWLIPSVEMRKDIQ
ncbi:hypothetical protein B7494_g7097 [Chlorociboria aeruginascens]|nr:hypothetical protein B7494_g7097 [Chlorociboria aeruginascens]